MARIRLFIVSFLLGMLFLSLEVQADQPKPWEMQFQQSATPVMETIQELHTILLMLITGIAFLVAGLLAFVIWRYRKKKNPVPSQKVHNVPLEIIWTAIPTCIVIALMFPALRALYFMDQVPDAAFTIKVTGHQWYWSYAYPDHKIGFDSYMIADKDLKLGDLRLLTVDNPLVIPARTVVRIQTTSADVIHSWAVPSFGIKRDSIPGRLSEVWVRVDKEGTYYGQCSELCGTGHAFMPIQVKVVSKEAFDTWLKEAEQKFA